MSIIYPPEVKLEVIRQETVPQDGFLKILRSTVRAHYPDGKISEPFTVDSVIRSKQDAVVIVGHFWGTKEQGLQPRRYVFLRSSFRPSIMLRDYTPSKLLEESQVGNLFELPAGLVELEETGPEGLRRAAAREFEEEVGYSLSPQQFKLLGQRTFSSVGMSANRIFFFEVEVQLAERGEPTLDGSPMEEGGEIIYLPVVDALKYVEEGYLPDLKTELGLKRLAAKFKDKL
jgi:ADP-ribose pyrophosphatase